MSHPTLNSFNFSKRIMIKYGIFRKTAKLPDLIFLRLSGIRNINRITNVKRQISVNNLISLHLGTPIFPSLLTGEGQGGQTPPARGWEVSGWRLIRFNPDINHKVRSISYPEKRYLFSEAVPAKLSSGHATAMPNPGQVAAFRYQYNENRTVPVEVPLGKGLQNTPYNGRGFIHPGASSSAVYKHRNTFSFHGIRPVGEVRVLTSYSGRDGNKAIQQGRVPHNGRFRFIDALSGQRQYPSASKPFATPGLTVHSRVDESGRVVSGPVPQRDLHNAATDDLYFRNQKKMELEVANIKLVMEEKRLASEVAAHSDHPSRDEVKREINRQLDINLISNQVYREIERRIRMERERRGL